MLESVHWRNVQPVLYYFMETTDSSPQAANRLHGTLAATHFDKHLHLRRDFCDVPCPLLAGLCLGPGLDSLTGFDLFANEIR